MKIVAMSLVYVALIAQAQARECTTQDGLDQAVKAMKSELQSDLPTQASQMFQELKGKVSPDDYAQLQTYDKSLDPAKAVQLEAVLVQKLQVIATGIDSTVKCMRDRNAGIAHVGEIHWLCASRITRLELDTNDGQGFFRFTIEKTFREGLLAPLAYTHQVTISERYNKIKNESFLREVLFPARENGGAIVNREIVQVTPTNGFEMTLEELAKSLTQFNQGCQ